MDDLNDWINTNSWAGRRGIKTPNFKRLADMSMSFLNSNVPAPACAPSRLAIMTGVHPVNSGVTGWRNPEWRKVPKLEKVETIEQFFKARGYKTLAGGKIYHTLAPPRVISNQSEDFGWDFYFPSVQVPIPFQVRAPLDSITVKNITEIPQPDYFSWGAIPLDDKYMADYQIVDWANYELSQKHDKPLFLAVGLTKPHDPWEVPQKYFDLYPLDSIQDVIMKKDDLNDAWIHGRRPLDKFIVDNKQTKKVIQAYMATISFTDAMLGRLLDGFEKSSYKDNTIIVLWSDHGMHMGEKENWEKLKQKERKKSVLSGVPEALPALIKALRIQDKSKQVGFEWDTTAQVQAKVMEELAELNEAMEENNQDHIEEEFGDVLFSLVNLARFLKVDPELALERTNRKFIDRFNKMEIIAEENEKSLLDMNLVEMDALWNFVKSKR